MTGFEKQPGDQVIASDAAAHSINPDVLCVGADEICPERARLVALYTMDVDAGLSDMDMQISEQLPEFAKPELDGAKLASALAIHTAQALAVGCQGAENGICQARASSDVGPNASRNRIGALIGKLFPSVRKSQEA